MPRIIAQPNISIRTKLLAKAGSTSRNTREQPERRMRLECADQRSSLGLPMRPAGGARGFDQRHGSAPAQQALRPHGQHDHHDDEGEHDRVGRHVDRAELVGEADQHRAERGARDRAHAADDDDDQRGKQDLDVLALLQRLERAADDAGEAREPGAEREYERGR